MRRFIGWSIALAFSLAMEACSTVTLCCPNHGGMIQSHTIDLLGTTNLTCGTNSASVGGPTALLSAVLPLIAAAGKTPVAAQQQPSYTCQ